MQCLGQYHECNELYSDWSDWLCRISVFDCHCAILCIHLARKKGTKVSTFESILFFFLYVGFGLFGMISAEGFVLEVSWKNALELLPIIGALMAMMAVFARGEQRTRLFLLLNGASWVVYTAIIGATTFFSSTASMVSSVIALWKYRNVETKQI